MVKMNRDPSVMKTQSGGGCLMLFGSPFFLAGLFMMAGGVGLIKVEGDGPDIVLLPFGLIFAAVGAGLMFGRSGVILDQRKRTAEKWWGLLVPFSRKSFPLESYNMVTIRKEVRRSKNSTTTYHPVRMESTTAAVESITLSSETDYAKARKTAEDAAKFLHVTLYDYSSGGEAVVRKPDSLDESVAERVRRQGPIVLPPMPPNMASQVGESSGALRILVPPPGNSILSYFAVVPGAIFAFFASTFIVVVAATDDMPIALKAVVMAVLLVFFIGFPIGVSILPVLRNRVSAQTVTADAGFLRVETKGIVRTATEQIPAAEVEEIAIIGPPDPQGQFFGQDAIPPEQLKYGVSTGQPGVPNIKGGQFAVNLFSSIARAGKLSGFEARSDKKTIYFGRGLSHAELVYLRALIQKALAG